MRLFAKYCFSAIAILLFLDLSSQNSKKSDSLRDRLDHSLVETEQIQLLHKLYLATDSVHYAEQGMLLAKKLNDQAGLALTLTDLGKWNYFGGNEEIALNYLIDAKRSAEQVNDKKTLQSVYRYIGFIYRPHDPYKAKEYYEKSLDLCNEIGDELASSYAYSAIGNIYEGFQGKNKYLKDALDNYSKSLAIRERLGSQSEIAASLNETSRVYDAIGNYKKAEELRLRGLKIAEASQDNDNIVFLSSILGESFESKDKDYKKALSYQLRAYELAKLKASNFEMLHDITRSMANCYHGLGKEKEGNEFYRISNLYEDSLNVKKQRQMYNLSGVNQVLEKELQEEKLRVKDLEIAQQQLEVDKQTNLRNLFLVGFGLVLILILLLYKGYKQKLKINRELDKKNQEIEEVNMTLAKSENMFKQITETIHDVFYLYNIKERKYDYVSPNCNEMLGIDQQYFYSGKSTKAIVHPEDLPIVVEANVKVDNGIAYDIEYRIHYQNEIRWIAEKSSPIFDEKGELVRNSGICRDITLRKRNEEALMIHGKELTASIHVARTIQDAILVPKEKISKKFSDFFILSKPKEIVSGDFYFYKETKKGIFIAVADCTGHGVPAGFMSMIGNAFLIEIINNNELISPAEALNELRSVIIRSLHQNDPDAELNDGMDIALLYFDKKLTSVQFAGAFNPLYTVRDGNLLEEEADHFPIGTQLGHELKSFKNHSHFVQKGDQIYIFSDGFSDQLGGSQGRKFGKKKFKDLLLSVSNKPMTEQESLLAKAYEDWKRNAEQVDDVMVLGMKI